MAVDCRRPICWFTPADPVQLSTGAALGGHPIMLLTPPRVVKPITVTPFEPKLVSRFSSSASSAPMLSPSPAERASATGHCADPADVQRLAPHLRLASEDGQLPLCGRRCCHSLPAGAAHARAGN